jgi:hypothetical protein
VCIDFLISRSVFYSPSKEGSFLFYDGCCSGWFGNFSLSLLAQIVAFNTHGNGNKQRHALSCMYAISIMILGLYLCSREDYGSPLLL